MSFIDLFFMGIRNLWRRKTRTLLTLLSVAVGAACIIVMISLGIGVNQSYMDMLEGMGSLTVIQVYPQYTDMGEPTPMNDKALQDLESIPHVVAAMPSMWVNGMMVSGKQYAWGNVMAIDFARAKHFDYELAEGAIPEDVTDYTGMYIVGQDVPNYFSNPKNYQLSEPVDMMNEDVYFYYEYNNFDVKKLPKKSDGYKMNVVGMLRDYSNQQQQYTLYMDISTYKKMMADKAKSDKSKGGGNGGGGGVVISSGRYASSSGGSSSGRASEIQYNDFSIKVDDMRNVADVSKQIQDMGYYCYSLTDQLNELQGQSGTQQAILGGVGIVALFISAIGITNTMVMAIYERTKEIGVMKVIGARIADIQRLFLFEAAVIGLVGGIFGLLVSFVASFILNQSGGSLAGDMWYLDQSKATLSIIPFWLYGLGLLFSTLVGIISGFYPARRAATKISALEAIRNE